MSHKGWRRAMVLLVMVLAGFTCVGCRKPSVDLILERSQVWKQPQARSAQQVTSNAKAVKGDHVWTQQRGRALLKWSALWVRLYDDTELRMEEVEPSGVRLSQNAGQTLNGGVSKLDQYVLKTGGHAEIKFVGTTVMVAFHRLSALTVVRVFDGQAEVRNLTGARQETRWVSADEWALVEPGEVPRVSDRLDEMRDLARELGLWDVFHEVELDVRDGFGPDESRVPPGDVDIVFEQAQVPEVSFWVDRDCILSDECTALVWEVDFAEDVSIDGQSVPVRDAWEVCPEQTTIYRLRASNAAGQVEQKVTITVLQVDFWTEPDVISQGECALLVWTLEGAQEVYLNGQRVKSREERSVCPAETTTYDLSMISDCGEWKQSRTVEVVPAPAEDTEPPPVPGQLSPQDDSALDYYPRELTLRWFPVDDPSGVVYGVEVEAYYPAFPGPGGEWEYTYGEIGLDSTSFSLNFIGAQPGRWRVWAIDGAGNASAKTEWWYFEFLQ